MMISKFDSAFNSFKSPKTANNSDCRLRRARVKRRGAGLLSIALLAAALHPGPAYAAENDAVRVWNERAVVTLVNGHSCRHARRPVCASGRVHSSRDRPGRGLRRRQRHQGRARPLPERTEGSDQRVQGRGGFDSGASCPDRPRRSGAVDGDPDRRGQVRYQSPPRCRIRQLAGRDPGRPGKGQGYRSWSRGCGGDAGQSGR